MWFGFADLSSDFEMEPDLASRLLKNIHEAPAGDVARSHDLISRKDLGGIEFGWFRSLSSPTPRCIMRRAEHGMVTSCL
jgi:hypothetical protein